MPLFKKNKAKKNQNHAYATENEHFTTDRTITKNMNNGNDGEYFPPKPFKFAPNLSKTKRNIGGLNVNIFGLEELTLASSRSSAASPPDLCIAIHMHGRGGSADNEEKIVRQIWDRVERSKRQYAQQSQRHNSSDAMLEFLMISFDARNHGHRMTNETGQKGWKQGNKDHAMDLYSMIVGTAQDVSFLVDFLPSYLFPHDERRVVNFAVTGKSLGGHSVWHVLANCDQIKIGVPFISCPDMKRLLAQRAPKSFVSNGPPYIPASLSSLISRIDPASLPYNISDPSRNPFWGKRICICNGQEDRLVPWSCAEGFVQGLIVGPPNIQRNNFRVVLQEGIGHEVTEQMIEEAGHWIFLHGLHYPIQ